MAAEFFHRICNIFCLQVVCIGEGTSAGVPQRRNTMLNAPVPGIDREQTLKRLMTEYGSAVLRVCFLYLKDYSQAQDASQTVFMKVWEALGKPGSATLAVFTSPASAELAQRQKAWLMRVTVNTCKNVLKSREYRTYAQATPLDQLPEPIHIDAYPDDTVLTAVMSLPDKYREVVVLHHYQGLPLTDTADVLRLSHAAVRTRLLRARRMLHPMLKGWYFDE